MTNLQFKKYKALPLEDIEAVLYHPWPVNRSTRPKVTLIYPAMYSIEVKGRKGMPSYYTVVFKDDWDKLLK